MWPFDTTDSRTTRAFAIRTCDVINHAIECTNGISSTRLKRMEWKEMDTSIILKLITHNVRTATALHTTRPTKEIKREVVRLRHSRRINKRFKTISRIAAAVHSRFDCSGNERLGQHTLVLVPIVEDLFAKKLASQCVAELVELVDQKRRRRLRDVISTRQPIAQDVADTCGRWNS